MRVASLVLSLSLVLLASCGEEPPPSPEELEKAAEDAAAKYRDRIGEWHARIREIGEAASAVPQEDLPPLELGAGTKLPRHSTGTPRLDLDLKFLLDPTIDAFRDPDFVCLGEVYLYQSPLFWLEGKWGDLFRDRTPQRVTEFMTERIEDLLGKRWLLVYRTHEFEAPVMLEKNAEPKDWCGRKIVGSFVSGSVRGDVLVYEIATRKLLGGLPFRAESSSQVDMAKFKTDPDHLRSDLARNAKSVLRKALAPHVAND